MFYSPECFTVPPQSSQNLLCKANKIEHRDWLLGCENVITTFASPELSCVPSVAKPTFCNLWDSFSNPSLRINIAEIYQSRQDHTIPYVIEELVRVTQMSLQQCDSNIVLSIF